MTALSGGPVWAEVVTDGTMGRRGVVRGGLDVTVRAGLGQLRGTNLFHSFERFGIAESGKVTFTGPDGVTNVIARVTGGERSDILGTLASTMPAADFFLINPAGILFGPNAKLDLKGSFHASTADQLRLADGAVFSALDTAGSTLSVAEPQSFGFLGARTDSITVNRGILRVAPGKQLSLSAGAVTLSGGTLLAGDPAPRDGVVEQGGRITLAALTSGTFDLAAGDTSGAVGGVIGLSDQAHVDASGNGGGSIKIRAEDISLSGQSQIVSANLGGDPALAGIDVGGGRLTLTGGSVMAVDVGLAVRRLADGSPLPRLATAGAGGRLVAAMTGEVAIREGSRMRAATYGLGNAGTVTVTAPRLTIDGTGFESVTGIQGTAGIDPGRAIRPGTADVTGAAGNVTIRVADLEMRGGGSIGASTFTTGNAGRIDIEAGRRLLIDGRGAIASEGRQRPTQIVATSGRSAPGGPGMIRVVAGSLEMVNNGDQPTEIRGSTTGTGHGTPVYIRASDLVIDGRNTVGLGTSDSPFTGIVSATRPGSTGDAGSITVVVDGGLVLRNGGEINGLTEAGGNASSISISAHDLTIEGLGAAANRRTQIISNTSGRGVSGDGGSIDVDVVGRLELRNGARIATSTQENGTGDAGPISVAAGSIKMSEASVISASTGTVGDAGAVSIAASGRLTLAGTDTRIASNARSSGDAGTVTVKAGTIELFDGGQITSNASGAGDAGALDLSANDVVVGTGASISTGTSGVGAAAGNGGKITLAAGRSLLIDGGSIASNSTGDGDGGNIVVNAAEAVIRLNGVDADNPEGRLAGAGEITAAADGDGSAGIIDVTARQVLAKNGLIRTTSELGKGGTITVMATERIYLRESEIASDGKVSRQGASVMTIEAPQIILSNGRMTSLTNNQPLAGSGEVTVTGGDITIVSADSTIRGSTKTLISGLQTNLGSDLQLSPGIFLDTNSLLQPSCADRGAARSTFTRSGRGGVPAAPDRPLPSAGADAAGAGRVAAGGTVFLDACAGSLVPKTKS